MDLFLPISQSLMITPPSQLKRAVVCLSMAVGLVTAAFTSPQAFGQGTAPIADLAGRYMGYVSPTGISNNVNNVAPPPSSTSIPNEDLGARIDLTVTSAGAVSGKLVFGPTIIPLAGALTVRNGQADVTMLLPITKYARSVRLFLNPSTNQSSGGSLAYGTDSSASGGQSLFVYKNTWVGRSPSAYLMANQTFVVYTGKRVVIPNGIISGSPQGFGFGSVRANGTSGTYIVAGTLGDGSNFTTSGFYGSNGQVLIYQYLYASLGGGSFLAPLTINPGNLVNITQQANSPYVSGMCSWIKRPSPRRTVAQSPTWKRFPNPSAGPADTLYPNGFYQSGSIEGSEFTAPAPGEVLSLIGLVSQGPPASISSTARFIHDSINSINFSQSLTITSQSASSRSNQVSLSSPVRNSVRFTQFDVSTGQFRGSFILSPPLRPATFEGMLVKSGLSNRYLGYGFFIIRDLKSNILTIPSLTPQLSDQRISGAVYLGISDG